MHQSRLTKVALTAGMLVAGLGLSLPAVAGPSVADMSDIRVDHWAFSAIQAVVEKYGIIEGFPDHTFKGQRTLTRFEFSAALARVMQRISEMQGNGRDVATPDLKVLRDLHDEFKVELTSLKAADSGMADRIKKLEDDLAALDRAFPPPKGRSALGML